MSEKGPAAFRVRHRLGRHRNQGKPNKFIDCDWGHGGVLFRSRGCEIKFFLHLRSHRDVSLAKSVPVTSWSSPNFFLMASSTIFRPNTPPPYSPALSLKRGRKKCLNWERNSQVNNKPKKGKSRGRTVFYTYIP